MERQIALDTETTGLSAAAGHRLTELGCVEIIDRKLTGKTFQTYLNPEREIDAEAQRITGLTREFLIDQPIFSQIAAQFLEFIHGAELIIHNAQFDLSFINYELSLLQKKSVDIDLANIGITIDNYHPIEQRHKIYDTLLLARRLYPGQKNNLDALCQRYQIDNTKRAKHGALLDAEILAQLYLTMTAGQISLNLTDSAIGHPHGNAQYCQTQYGDPRSRSSRGINTDSVNASVGRSGGATTEAVANAHNINLSSKPKHNVRTDLLVVRASSDELVEHHKYLQAIKASSGSCIWSNNTK